MEELQVEQPFIVALLVISNNNIGKELSILEWIVLLESLQGCKRFNKLSRMSHLSETKVSLILKVNVDLNNI